MLNDPSVEKRTKSINERTSPDQKKSSNYRSPKEKNPNLRNMPWLSEPYNSARGETALWVAVITQAMMDALSRAGTAEAAYHKHEAMRWLTDSSKDFIEVCLFAGLDPGYVRRKAKKALISPVSWRAAPGKGKRYLERKAYRQRNKKSQCKEEYSPATDSNVISGPWVAGDKIRFST